MTHNIQPILTNIITKLRQDYQPEQIILYGSYAYGTPNEHSDIDLFIVKDTELRRVDRYVEVARLIFDPERRISVSPLVYTPKEFKERVAMGDAFVKEIITRGKVLYAETE